MSRYRRVAIDGDTMFKTETRKTAAALLPGTIAVINGSNQFAVATAIKGRVYVLEAAYHEGLGIRDAIPIGHSAVGNYVEEGRELALLAVAGVYVKDSPIKLGTSGRIALASSDTDAVIGYSQDTVTLTGGDTDFLRVRFRLGTDA